MGTADKPRVVVVGGGFAGLWAARRLAWDGRAEVVLVDRNNYHTFMPLLYQVAAAELEPEEIAYPLRGVFRKYDHVRLVQAEVRQIDRETGLLRTSGPDLAFDYLILATGSVTTFFGVAGADTHCFRLKSLEQAIALRNHILSRFELAANEPDPAARQRLLTFVIIGGGPTGVEYAGALKELIRVPLARDFPGIAPDEIRVVLLEAGPGLLNGFPDELRAYAAERLRAMGVDVRLGVRVAAVETDRVRFGDGSELLSDTVVWTAGVRGRPEIPGLLGETGAQGRIKVLPCLQLGGDDRIFLAGDVCLPGIDAAVPMVAPMAVQQGLLAAENVLRRIEGRPVQDFAPQDKGSMATIGRQAAVARLGKTALTGFSAWVLWLVVHLLYLIGFRNRLLVAINWAWDYVFFERAIRLILPGVDKVHPGGERYPEE